MEGYECFVGYFTVRFRHIQADPRLTVVIVVNAICFYFAIDLGWEINI